MYSNIRVRFTLPLPVSFHIFFQLFLTITGGLWSMINQPRNHVDYKSAEAQLFAKLSKVYREIRSKKKEMYM